MATYPNTQLNLGQTSPDNRNELYTGEKLAVLDREQTSFLALFDLAKNYVLSKDNADSFRDFYAGSIGSTLIELASGYSEFNSYATLVARRESYLYEAQLLDSAIGIAENLGYSTFRGQNPKLTISFIPTVNATVSKFDILGNTNGGDIISLEDKELVYGEEVDIQVVLGTLKVASLTIDDSRTYEFRFTQSKISEDIQLELDGTIVPISNIIYDLLNDKFVIMSNPVGGVDVKYLNKSQPEKWVAFERYTFLDYVLPSYEWRSQFHYNLGDVVCSTSLRESLPILYKCVKEGVSNTSEPVWNEQTDAITTDGMNVQWQCIGRMKKQLFFRNTTPGISISGIDEPVWPIELGQIATDGSVTWVCSDTFEYAKYFYNTGSTLQLSYVELEDVQYSTDSLILDVGTVRNVSVENEFKDVESLAEIKRNAPLYNETKYVIRGREDYRKIFQILLGNCVDTNGFDPIPAVVELTYVKDHTNKVWSHDTYFESGQEVMPTVANGFIYRTNSAGYSASSKHGVSGIVRPTWIPDTDDRYKGRYGTRVPELNTINDNGLFWNAYYMDAKPPLVWTPSTDFQLGDRINIGHPDIYFQLDAIVKEPVWPTEIGKSVQDNGVIWTCIDDIYFEGYDSDYWKQNYYFAKGTIVTPVLSNGYIYQCIQGGISGSQEPDWSTVICSEIQDHEIVWQCYDRENAPKYTKNITLRDLEKYRQYGVSPPVITDPNLVMLHVNFNLTVTDNVDTSAVQVDLFNIVDKYQRILQARADIPLLEAAAEELPYVMIARANFFNVDSTEKIQTWKAGQLYRLYDVIKVEDNPYLYYVSRIETGAYGYSQWTDRSYSGFEEPDWTDVTSHNFGDKIKDKNLIWELCDLNKATTPVMTYWEPDTVYPLGSCVLPTSVTNTPYYAKLVEIVSSVPDWPLDVGKSILDGRIYWTCFDPTQTSIPLSWNEYYMIDFTFSISRYR